MPLAEPEAENPNDRITPWHPWSVGSVLATTYPTAPSSGAWPSANRAYYYPLCLPQQVLVRRVFWFNGTAVSGTTSVAVYSEAGTQIVTTGSVSGSGTSAIQFVDITDTLLPAGRYYMAISCSNGTQAFTRVAGNIVTARFSGCLEQATAHPCPSSMTGVVVASGDQYFPLFGLVMSA
jgi:hypothetical protein